jgi:hypothetical protein
MADPGFAVMKQVQAICVVMFDCVLVTVEIFDCSGPAKILYLPARPARWEGWHPCCRAYTLNVQYHIKLVVRAHNSELIQLC